jgi:hypothetical protein
MADQKLVQVNLLEGTIQRLNDLQEKLGVRNRTDAIVRAIEIAQPLVEAVLAGKDIVMETRRGVRERFIIPGVGRVVTYFAVIHGEPGHETFRPMLRKPAFSQVVFEYEGPEMDEKALRDDFDRRFLPLKVEKIDADGRRTLGDECKGDQAIKEAMTLANVMLDGKGREWVLISTQDSQVLRVLPKGIRMSPMPFVVADDWCRKGAMISRPMWDPPMLLVGKHASIKGAYIARMDDGSMETRTLTDADQAALDWSGLGPAQ